jgi:restriction system protein
MAKPLMWMVRAGEGGYLFDEFYKNSIVAIGWSKLGDLTEVNSLEGIRTLYLNRYPGEKPAKIGNAVAMIFKFRAIFKPEHKVITYNPATREYLVGTIRGEYKFMLEHDYHHVRMVEWLGLIERDSLKAPSRNTLGSILALFQLNEETVDDVLNVLQGEKTDESDLAEDKEDLEQLKEDTISRAHELIKDRILKLDDEELEQLVAAILRAMGYKTRLTPKGPDRGVDVIASPDGLGLEEPRIKAEVKHRPKSQMGSQEVRSFLGGMRQGDRALYVSTGGFSKDAGYEADRSNIPITLLNLDELASLVVTHYENFDMEGKVLIPLTQLYWPAE